MRKVRGTRTNSQLYCLSLKNMKRMSQRQLPQGRVGIKEEEKKMHGQ